MISLGEQGRAATIEARRPLEAEARGRPPDNDAMPIFAAAKKRPGGFGATMPVS